MKMKLAALALALSLAACTTAPPATNALPELTFEQMAPISLHVAKIEVHDEFRTPVTQDHVEHLFPKTPAAAARELVEKKLTADGFDNILRVIIEDASVIEQKLPVSNDFWSNFTREPSERYNARVSLRFELVNEQAPDIIIGHASVIGERTKTVIEGTSPADRDRAYIALTEELMGDLYNGLDTVVRNTFSRR